MRRTLKTSERGFTLLEVVIAVSIMVMMFGVIYTALGQLMRTKNYLDDERDLGALANTILNRFVRELQLATDQVKLLPPQNDLKHIYPDTVDLLGKHERLPNGGAGDSITFMANDGGQYVYASQGETHTGIVQITYRVVEDPDSGGGHLLIRDEVPFSRAYAEAYKKIMTFPITRDLVGLEFQYYDGNKWEQEWDENRRELPRLIRFVIKISSPSGAVHTFSTIVPVAVGDLAG